VGRGKIVAGKREGKEKEEEEGVGRGDGRRQGRGGVGQRYNIEED